MRVLSHVGGLPVEELLGLVPGALAALSAGAAALRARSARPGRGACAAAEEAHTLVIRSKEHD